MYLVWIWYVIMTRSGVCWIMLHREFSDWFSKVCLCSARVSWLLRALRDVSDESLLAKYLLLLLLPVTQGEIHSHPSILLLTENVVPLFCICTAFFYLFATCCNIEKLGVHRHWKLKVNKTITTRLMLYKYGTKKGCFCMNCMHAYCLSYQCVK